MGSSLTGLTQVAVTGVIGHIHYDEGKEESNYSTCVSEDAKALRGVYVRVDDSPDLSFVARIIDGPFQTRNLRYYLLELTSMMINGQLTAVRSRPRPGSPVRLLEPEKTQSYIGAVGDLRVGRLLGQKDVELSIDSTTLPRHLGFFGTTGSGKSNSLQVIAEEVSKLNRGVLIFDIEGEYVRMDEPTEDLKPILAEFGEGPEGAKNFRVYVPSQYGSLNPDASKFGIPFADIDLELFSEVLGLTPFERVYLFEVARKARDMSGSFKAYDINTVIDVLKKRIESQVDKATIPEAVTEAHMGLYTKLTLAQRTGVIDASYERIVPEAFCVSGRISVVDLSEASDLVRNICISHFLKEIFRYKTRYPQSTPLIIFMEEIHTFISRAKRRMMIATITMVTEMARQGRKRGIALGLVSQQPALVPSELIELCNTRFIHRVSSTPNIEALRRSTGNVPDTLWALLSSLGKGEVLISSPKLEHAVIAQIRPNKSKRLRVEYS